MFTIILFIAIAYHIIKHIFVVNENIKALKYYTILNHFCFLEK